jgi:DNA-binding beta-propeller fold protein YncE
MTIASALSIVCSVTLWAAFGAVDRTVPASSEGTSANPSAQSKVTAPLTLEFHVPLPGVSGRIDHLAVDQQGQRLFVAALGNNTVEAVDLTRHQSEGQLTKARHPQGLAYLSQSGRLVIAAADDPVVQFFDMRARKVIAQATLGDDCDNVRLAADGHVLVGYGDGSIALLDGDGHLGADIPVGGHPESFQLEPGTDRVFVNVPTRHEVVVIDRARKRVLARWPVPAAANYPMGVDGPRHRLYIGCRQPAEVVVFDTRTGAVTARAPTIGDADDLFWDEARRRVYVIGGAGAIAVLDVSGDPRELAQIRTRGGARTGLWISADATLYVAAPAREGEPAAILAYRANR